MVTKTKRAAPAGKKAPESVESARRGAGKPNLLRAGLKALGDVRDDVVQHQSRLFEAILGVEPGAAWAGMVKRDSRAAKLAQEALGLRKFEEVFDERVASALQRLGLPSADALRAMRAEIDALRAEIVALKKTHKPKAKAAAPDAKPTAPSRARRSA